MADIGFGKVPVCTPRGEHVLLQFSTTGAATPTVATNGNMDGVIDETVAYVDGGAGDHTYSLRERWAYLHPVGVNVQTTAGTFSGNAIVDTSTNPQTVRVLCFDTDATAVLDDPAATVNVTILARRNTA
jgi:hypothetical protein